jgi:lysophospholipid acyltransferase (LPLAT)-like uncharacterized protein
MQPFGDQFSSHEQQRTAARRGASHCARDAQEFPIPLDRVSRTVYMASRVIGTTWRYRLDDPHGLRPGSGLSNGTIYCFWHEHLLPGFHRFRHHELIALISPSRDGERLSSVLQRWGYTLIRGSSSRKGLTSLRQSIRALRDGKSIVITPDGPRGPRRVAKPGAAQLALATGARLVPIAITARPALRLRSWDRFVVPLPFATVQLRLRQALDPRTVTEEQDPPQALLTALEQGLTHG